MFRPSFVLVMMLPVGLLAAPNSPMKGPVEGFVFDAPTAGFRAVFGSLGAASLSPVLLGGFEFGAAVPGKNYAVAYKAGQCFLVTDLDGLPASTAISDSCSLPDVATWSADGSTAVFYAHSGNWLQIVTGLPDQPTVQASISLAGLGDSLPAVATDVNGGRVFVAITGAAAGIYEVQKDQSLAVLQPLSEPIALAVAGDRQILYALDAVGNQICELSLTDLSSQAWTVASLQNPVSIKPARDIQGRPVLYVAGGSDQMLIAYDASSHAEIVTVPLDFSPLVIEPLAAHSFLLRRRVSDSDTLWSFDDAPSPAAFFVPATPLVAAGGLQ